MRAPQQGARNSQPPVAMMRGEQRGDEQKERNEQRFVCVQRGNLTLLIGRVHLRVRDYIYIITRSRAALRFSFSLPKLF